MSNILIVGAGVVGQATGKGFRQKGHHVAFVDVNNERLAQLRQQGWTATRAQDAEWHRFDIILLTVSTPTIDDQIVLDHIRSATRDIGHGIAESERYATIMVRSTVPPTTTEQIVRPILEEASGKRVGVDFGVGMNPEFLRQRYSEDDFNRPWITVLGTLDARTDTIMRELYRPFGGSVVSCTPTEAEMIKYVNNVYNALKISYFNEVHQLCTNLNIDSNVVGSTVAHSAEGMWNAMYGTRGGAPYGGACLPKDTAAFKEFCEQHGWQHLMLDATIAVNQQLVEQETREVMPEPISVPQHPLTQVDYKQTDRVYTEHSHASNNGASQNGQF
ncbi:MAG: NAD(P)-binding domain-containing protein [Chloroflexota bacterium]